MFYEYLGELLQFFFILRPNIDRGCHLAPRRSFIQNAVTAGIGTGLLSNSQNAFGDATGRLNEGDAAILRFLAAAEILESDLWEQYWELSSATGVNSFFEAFNPATGTKPTPTGGNAA